MKHEIETISIAEFKRRGYQMRGKRTVIKRDVSPRDTAGHRYYGVRYFRANCIRQEAHSRFVMATPESHGPKETIE